jgi:hypothetical protein
MVWTRRPPRRAAGRLLWTALAAIFVCGPAWLLFAGEPRQADDGAINPLALIVPTLAALFAAVLVPQLLALVRRPIVSANYYALTVRPGVVRTLVLPWAHVVELCAVRVDDEPVLLIRCGPRRRAADWPHWWDQAYLRSVRRGSAGEPVAAYDLAVPMSDFAGAPDILLTTLARWAPAHVAVLNKTD